MLFKVSGVKKSYGTTEVLKDVSFQVNPGDKVGLVGRNGAGKSTLYRIICGEESADEGTVEKAKGLAFGLLQQHVDFSEDESVHTAALSAFERLHDIEARMRELEVEMESDPSDENLEEYASLQTEFETQGGFDYTSKAEAILLGLGFPKEDWDLSTQKLSGGQKNRLGMARLLLSDADLLLLDEPTNHLDVGAVEWLEGFLVNSGRAYVIISHDRYFLDRTAEKIVEIENGRAFVYSGNYSFYVKESELQKEQRQREFENQQAYIAKTEAFIRKNLAGQKTKQAKSRRNMLSRMDRLESVKSDDRGGNFSLRNLVRTGNNVLVTNDLEIGYPDKRIGGPFNLLIHRGDCVGIIGGNGTGKTTLLKTLLNKLEPLGGDLIWGTKVNIGYYAQELDGLNPDNDLVSEMREVDPLAESGPLRSFLAGFLFYGDDVFKRVSDLSGGEKGRLALAKLVYSESNVLVLDEPTNHLDIISREALERALAAYQGTIIAVSHDRYFLDRIANQILSLDDGGELRLFTGNYSDYFKYRAGQIESVLRGNGRGDENGKGKPGDSAPAGLSKNEIQRRRKRLGEIETEIGAAEKQLEKLGERVSAAAGEDVETYLELESEYGKLESALGELYGEWEDIENELESD